MDDNGSTNQYYDISGIDALNAVYNLIYGKRSNGKTYSVCRKIVDGYLDEGLPSALIRRLDEMIKPKNISELFNPHIDYIIDKTEGKYNAIEYRANAFYLCCYQDGVLILRDKKPFCRTYAINTAETTKGQDAGEVKYILFDEFITRQFYLTNEFVLYQNLLSSIIRDRATAKIYMVANTVSKYCPYFREMGLTRMRDQKQGTIDLYTMGATNTKIAVEYADAPGGLAHVLECLKDAGVNVEYIYAFTSDKPGQAYMILRPDDESTAMKALRGAGIRQVEQEELSEM